MKIRKNASLKSLAEATIKEALSLRKEWSRREDNVEQAPHSERTWRRSQADAAYKHFASVSEIANHLRRIAGIED